MAQSLAAGQLAATDTAIYTNTAPATVSIVDVVFYNTSGASTETVIVKQLLSGGTARTIARFSLPPNYQARVTGIGMGGSDVLSASASDATTVDYTIWSGSGDFTIGISDNTGATFNTSSNALTGNQAIAGTVTITSTSAVALTAGRQGATNPVLKIDASTSSVATGIQIKGAAAAGGVAVLVITSGTNESLTIDAAGSGTISLNAVSGTGNVILGDAINVQSGTTTGSKIGTTTLQKLAFWNATPIVQPANTVDYVTMLVNLGLRASGGTAGATFPGALSCAALTATSVVGTGTVALTGNMTISDATNIIVNAGTGTKIATATTQKLGFYNATPVVQPAANTDTTTGAAGGTSTVYLNTTYTGGGTAAYTVGGVVAALKALGLLAP